MANEITVTGSLTVYKSSCMSSAVARSIVGAQFTMSGTAHVQDTMSVPTSATAIPLGSVTQPHWAHFKNMDATNFIRIRNGSAGADLIKLKAGEWAIVPLYDSAVPYAIADTGACLLEYLILQL